MAYQVIARKWRPQSFAEVTGQEPITRTLQNAIEHERLHHAYLFSGARGVGKTTTARLLAKALNCHKATKPTIAPCRMDDPEACPSCKEISESRSIDVQEIDAASNTQVDNVREVIIGSVGFAPARDRFKIFIIDEVHMLSTNSFNALLKTIEEPPPRVAFIMATTEQHKVPETILSRCQQFEFRTIATARILERLRVIADSENISLPEEALREIARAGEGSMRDAQSAFDQVISFAGDKITKDDVELALGVAGADILTRIVGGIAEHQPAEALIVVDDLVMRGHDLRNFCRDLLAHFRDLLVAKVSGKDELLESAVCDRGELNRQAALFSESDLVRFFHSLADTETKLKTAAHPRYQLEVGLVKLMEMRRLQPLSDLVTRIAALEESLRTGPEPPMAAPASPTEGATKKRSAVVSATPPAPTSSRTARVGNPAVSGGGQRGTAVKAASEPASGPEVKRSASLSIGAPSPHPPPPPRPGSEPAPPPDNKPAAVTDAAATAAVTTESSPGPLDSPPESSTLNAGDSEIDRIRTALLKKRKMFLVTAFEGARRASIEENELYIEFDPAAKHLRDTLAKSDSMKVIRETCFEVTGKEMGVRIAIKDNETDDDLPLSREDEERREKQSLREIAEKNPVVQQVLRTFRGEIIDVQRTSES